MEHSLDRERCPLLPGRHFNLRQCSLAILDVEVPGVPVFWNGIHNTYDLLALFLIDKDSVTESLQESSSNQTLQRRGKALRASMDCFGRKAGVAEEQSSSTLTQETKIREGQRLDSCIS